MLADSKEFLVEIGRYIRAKKAADGNERGPAVATGVELIVDSDKLGGAEAAVVGPLDGRAAGGGVEGVASDPAGFYEAVKSFGDFSEEFELMFRFIHERRAYPRVLGAQGQKGAA